MEILDGQHPEVLEWGGKHGGLRALLDAGLGDHIAPTEFLKHGESMTQAALARLEAGCARLETDEVVVRTSHPGDWKGLTDAMPTRFCSLHNLPQVLEEVVPQLVADPALALYARNEGIDFHSEQVTYSVAPSLRPHSPVREATITEHPNTPELVFVDYYDAKEDLYQPHTYAAGRPDGARMEFEGNKVTEAGYALYERMRKGGALTDTEALQFEFGPDKGGMPFIYQIRRFARRAFTDVRSYSGRPGRFFGNINGEELHNAISVTITHTPGSYFHHGALAGTSYIWQDFERNHHEASHLMVRTELSDVPLTLDEQPRGMQAYVGRNTPLNHNHTRFVQYALERNGAAWLTNDRTAIDELLKKAGQKVTVYGVNPTNFSYC